MSPDSFETALDGARTGDDESFASLWQALNPALLRYLRATGGDATDDIASETWLRVARDLDCFAGSFADFRAWFFTIARHRLIDWQRSVTRRPTTPVGPEGLRPERDAPDAAEIVVANLDTDAAVQLIRRLAPRQAEVVSLLVIAGLDVHRVAEITQLAPPTVRVHLHRGLNRLADMLEHADEASIASPDFGSAPR